MASGVTGLLVVARMGSSRLPGKHLLPAGGKPMIWWLCARMAREFQHEIADGSVQLVIATSTAPGNEVLRTAVDDLPVTVFQGSDTNIPKRQSECAEALGLDRIISLDGDDVLCSFHAARRVHDALLRDGSHDIVTTSGLPLGMNVSGYPASYLHRSVEGSKGDRFETGWGRVFDAPRTLTVKLGEEPIDGPLRFTLDYPEDARFFQAVITGLGERLLTMKDEDLIGHVQAQGLFQLNAALQARYFANFHEERNKETDG